MLTSTEQHSFLDVLTEEEAVTMGVSVVERAPHHVYRAVRARSTAAALSREEFFTADTIVKELPGLSRPELISILAGLIRDRVVCQVFVLENEPGDRELRVRPCYLARLERTGPLFPLFLQCLHRCETAVRTRLAALEPLGPEELQADLELDLGASARPKTTELSGLAGGLLRCLRNDAFDIPPPPELLATVSGHLRRRLADDGAILPIRGFGLGPLAVADARTRFLVAEQFLEDRIIPLYKRNPLLRRELEIIALAEAKHTASGGERTATFSARRAGAVRRLFIQENSEQKWFAGALTVETVLAAAGHIDREFRAEDRKSREERIASLHGRLHAPNDALQSEILFVTAKDWDTEHAEVRQALLSHEDILYSTFELPGNTVHVFAPADPELLAQCVARLYGVPKAQEWKFWAVAMMLELFATRLKDLTNDARFQRELQSSLLQSSAPYLKWPLNLLVIAGRFFPSFFVERASAEVKERQHALRESNRAVLAAGARAEEQAKEERVRLACATALRELIDGRLDEFYFRDRQVPSFSDLVDSFSGVDSQMVRRALAEGRYLIWTAHHPTGDERLIAYSMEANWGIRVEQLRAHLGELSVAAESASPEKSALLKRRVDSLRLCLNDPNQWSRIRSADSPAYFGQRAAKNAQVAGGARVPEAAAAAVSQRTAPVALATATGAAGTKRGRTDGHYESLNPETGAGPIPGPKLFVEAAG